MTTIIAKFAKFEASLYAIMFLATCAIFPFILLHRAPGESLLSHFWSLETERFSYLIYLILSLLVGLMQVQILWQLIVEKGEAVWIADGYLHFLNNYTKMFFSRIPLESIDRLSVVPARSLRSSAIVLHLKGWKRKIHSGDASVGFCGIDYAATVGSLGLTRR